MTLDTEITISEQLCLLFSPLGWISVNHNALLITLNKNENQRAALKSFTSVNKSVPMIEDRRVKPLINYDILNYKEGLFSEQHNYCSSQCESL